MRSLLRAVFVIGLAMADAVGMNAFQGTGTPPPLAFPLNRVPTDAEVRGALQGDDGRLKEVVVGRATALAPHSLSDPTIRAITSEILDVTSKQQARFKEDPLRATEESSRGEYVANLAEVLMRQKNPAGIEGLVAVAHRGAPGYALVEYGDAAVPFLVRAATTEPEAEPGHADAVLEVLALMLESPTVNRGLSAASRASIRRVADFRLLSTKGDDNWHLLATAARLSLATGDPQLRQRVVNLIDNDAEFVKRGMSVEWQREVSAKIQAALAKSRQ